MRGLQKDKDVGLVLKAMAFVIWKHRDQRRKDAEASPYINHPIALAEVLWHEGGVRDPVIIAAALPHDTVEDTETTPEERSGAFGKSVAAAQSIDGRRWDLSALRCRQASVYN